MGFWGKRLPLHHIYAVFAALLVHDQGGVTEMPNKTSRANKGEIRLAELWAARFPKGVD